jgi:uncharacterized membrane protein YkvA (DUF1232 family)
LNSSPALGFARAGRRSRSPRRLSHNPGRDLYEAKPDLIGLLVISVKTRIRDWKQRTKSLKRDVRALYLAKRDPRMPWYAELLGGVILACALSPIDLIPDFIPVLGYLDDLILLPAGILLLLQLIPAEVMEEYRIKAENPELRISGNWLFGLFVVLLCALGHRAQHSLYVLLVFQVPS